MIIVSGEMQQVQEYLIALCINDVQMIIVPFRNVRRVILNTYLHKERIRIQVLCMLLPVVSTRFESSSTISGGAFSW